MVGLVECVGGLVRNGLVECDLGECKLSRVDREMSIDGEGCRSWLWFWMCELGDLEVRRENGG